MGDAGGRAAGRRSVTPASNPGVTCELQGVVMAKPFKGTINVDIRDSEPDWVPFEPPVAPYGAPNVVYIVLDDVGFSAMDCYGGPIETPKNHRIAPPGGRDTPRRTTPPCAP